MTARRWLTATRIGFLACVVIGFGIGAYLHWLWWHPSKTIALSMLEAALLVLGGLVALVPRRQPRRLGLAAVLLGAGMVCGHTFGPSRPASLIGTATVTIRLEQPEAIEVTTRGTCDYVAGFDQFRIEAGYDGRPAMISDLFAVSVSLSRGDMWGAGVEARADGLALTVSTWPISDPGLVTGRMSSVQSSRLSAVVEGTAGSLVFAGLAKDPTLAIQGRPMDLAGTLEWACTPSGF